jgi:hypothetical protein
VSLSKCLTNTIFSETSSVDGCYQRRSESMGEGPHLRLSEPFAQCDQKVTCARSFRGRLKKLAPHDSDQSLTCRVNTVQKVDGCSKLLRFRNMVSTLREGLQSDRLRYARFDSEYMIQIDL